MSYASFNCKLVRDNIPAVMEFEGLNPAYMVAPTDEGFKNAILEKLMEEVREFIVHQNDEEYTDIMDVLEAAREAFHVKYDFDLHNRKGGFRKRYVMEFRSCEECGQSVPSTSGTALIHDKNCSKT